MRVSQLSTLNPQLTPGPAELILPGVPSVSRPDTNQPLTAQLLQLARQTKTIVNHGTLSPGGRFAVMAGNGYVVVTDVARTNFFPHFMLNNPNDVEFTLSPNGRWLVTGVNNRPVQDVWDVLTGRRMTQITEPSHPACFFHPGTGHLVSGNPSEFLLREAGTWRELRCFPWPAGRLIAGLIPGSLAPDGRTLWTTTTDQQLALVDTASGTVFARLERPGGHWANSMGHDARGDHAYLGTAHNSIRHLDLRALRRELARLGLDWRDERPGEGFAPRAP